MSVQAQMPRYQCHKKVHALKIAAIEFHLDGSATIAPSDEGFVPFVTSAGFRERFKGDDNDLGYYIVYDDGYVSWSPTEAFEDGYTRM